ncbi:MAG: hypothetical protein A3C64_02915 [Candidatus Yanofskybacteria bacterium RIFCSPHIGHO2_02_FULL_41_12]|uniref:DUF8128 domain-containing protein n=1 Tax=Candidatus Yanofskybacteria bacterium GW2011_GWC2_41_9 TaxID=1619029 RepID=A0A0G1AP48_9BACT|nr:MAG: hypothetical protein UU84_C0011G0015 [Candidatus Yanofskybacteria bacterium GW2011_GWC2_41_9]OGN09522.1 MAG: hypothetical protein A3C64_02915 [Candidatus Yanofskybacteria bacterium RIFCSPHIGHO2_02_FULL_41_12]
MEQLSFALDSLNQAYNILSLYWWAYAPVLLFFGLFEAYQVYTRTKYISSLKWTLLELKIPKEIRKSPKATEQIFNALHGVFLPIKWRDKFFKGKVMDWFSFEIIGSGGEIHFFVRTIEAYKKLVQSQIYAQYPDTEITEAPVDYITGWPASMPDDKNDLWGAELLLNKEDAYPIRTYPEFEEVAVGKEDVKRVDPLASLSEVLSSLQYGEFIGIQLLIRPTGDGWIKKGQAVVDKIMGKEVKLKPDFLSKMIFAIDEYVPGHFPVEKKDDKKDNAQLSPGKQDILKAIEKSFAKLGFESGIRFIYAGSKEVFHRAHISGIMGAYKQFASQSLNGFKMNIKTAPLCRWPFKKQKEYNKKVFLWSKFKNRTFMKKPFVLNVEELATIFHFPDIGVKAPLLPRVETKKGEPPVGLPVS